MRNGKKPPKRVKVSVPEGGWQAKKAIPKPEIASLKKRVPELDWLEGDFQRKRIVWRFSEVDAHWDLLDNAVDNHGVLRLLGKLSSFESMQMGELFKPGSEHAKKYDVPTLPSHALDRLMALKRDDEDELVRLRFTGKGRLYGIMRGHVFHILWWDPHHRVWPSRKKHT